MPVRSIAVIGWIVLSGILIAVSAKTRRGTTSLGCMFAFMGLVSFLGARVTQRWGGGAPITGSFAVFVALLLVAFGAYGIYLGLFGLSDDEHRH